MKIRYTTPSGALMETTIEKPQGGLGVSAINGHVIKWLKDNYIKYKSFKIVSYGLD